MVASGGGKLTPLQEMQADSMAADTAHKTGLAEKMRAEVEAMNAAQAQRADPAVRTEYAAHSAGINLPEATQLARHIRGEMDPNPQGPADAADNVYGEVPVTQPENLPAGSERQFRSALASLIGNRIATGKTNAEQLAGAGREINEAGLTTEAAHTEDLPAANRIVAAVSGKLREPFAVGADGQLLNEETGDLDEGTLIAQAARRHAGARTASEGALQRSRDAHTELYRAQTGKTGLEAKRIERELSGADDGLPAQAFRKLTGAKLSDLTQEARLQWIQNHATGMSPQENLAALRQVARRDALLAEARQVYESQYPKTMMGQRGPGAPDFLSFARDYVAMKEGGERVPQPGGGGREARGRISGPGTAAQPATPRTQAEFDALPSGAIFIDPDDGKTYRKP